MQNSNDSYAKVIRRPRISQQRANIYLSLHCRNIVYLQHGGGNYCTQNDVVITPCILLSVKFGYFETSCKIKTLTGENTLSSQTTSQVGVGQCLNGVTTLQEAREHVVVIVKSVDSGR